MENYGTMEKKLWYNGKIYGTIPKTMTLIYYGKNHDTMYNKLCYYSKL